jgi:hypothetical protein
VCRVLLNQVIVVCGAWEISVCVKALRRVVYGYHFSRRATVPTWSGLSQVGTGAGTISRGVQQSARGLA